MKADESVESVESVLAEMRNFGPVTDAQRFAWANRIALAHAREAQDAGWQPIETAPKDGTAILATDGRAIVLTRHGAFSWTHEDRDTAVTRALTHWRPLPAIAARQQGEAHEA